MIVHIITGLNSGGAEGVLYRLCAECHDSNHRHTVISLMDRGVYGDRLESLGVTLHCLCMPRGWITVKGIFRLYRLLRRHSSSVVQTWMYHADLIGGVIAKLAGVKAVIWGIRGPLDLRETGFSTRSIARLCAWLSHFVPTRIVSNSNYAARVHQDFGYKPERFIVIPNGYPSDRPTPSALERQAARDELQTNRGLPLLGMVARFDSYKDHNNLFEALGLLKSRSIPFCCVLVGAGMDNRNAVIQRQINEAGISDSLRLLGMRDNIPAVMNALDVHILSSLGESFPNVIAEAMACGTPCVTTDVGDAALIVGDTGWVVPPRDPTALADAIADAIGALSDKDQWARRRASARLRIQEKFSVETMCSAYRNLWNDAAGRDANRGPSAAGQG